MNDTVLTELKIVVERAVRPLWAATARKRRMREELLAHLSAIFEEEAERLGNERAALERAKQRFGDPKSLTGQLQDTVPHWNRLWCFFELASLQPGESLPHYALKFALLFVIYFVFMVLVVALPSLLIRGRLFELGITIRVVCYTYLVLTSLITVWFILYDRMVRAFFLPNTHASRSSKALCIISSLLYCPAFGFLTYFILTGDLAESLVRLRIGCYFAPFAPILFFAVARQVAEEIRHAQEWADLKIDE